MAAFDTNRVTQSNVNAGRNNAARDNYDNSTNHVHNYFPAVYREDKRLRALVEEHEHEKRTDQRYRKLAEKLNNFLLRKADGSERDLTEKLTDADREHLIILAMELKEDVTKKITRNSHFQSAQKIYTYLLTQIRITFLSEISSRIKSGQFKQYEIDDFVKNRVIEPLLAGVDGCSLEIDKEELFGLLYILTGNCYVEWD